MTEPTTNPNVRNGVKAGDSLDDQMRFFAEAHLDAPAMRKLLAESRILVLGAGIIGTHAIRSLADSGVGSITVADTGMITEADAGNPMVEPEDIGITRAEAVVRRLMARDGGIHCHPLAVDARSSGDLAEAVRGMSCVVVGHDSPLPSVLDAINEATLATDIPWISGRIMRGRGFVGPAVIPWQSPCFKCYELRRNANAEDYDLMMQYESGLRGRENAPAECVVPRPLAASVGELLALEAFRIITRATHPQTAGRVLRVDFFAPEMTYHRILRVPSCPACGYGKSRTVPEVSQLPPGYRS